MILHQERSNSKAKSSRPSTGFELQRTTFLPGTRKTARERFCASWKDSFNCELHISTKAGQTSCFFSPDSSLADNRSVPLRGIKAAISEAVGTARKGVTISHPYPRRAKTRGMMMQEPDIAAPIHCPHFWALINWSLSLAAISMTFSFCSSSLRVVSMRYYLTSSYFLRISGCGIGPV